MGMAIGAAIGTDIRLAIQVAGDFESVEIAMVQSVGMAIA